MASTVENPPGPAEAMRRSLGPIGGVVMSNTQWAKRPKWASLMQRAFIIRPSRPTPYTKMWPFWADVAVIWSTKSVKGGGVLVGLVNTDAIWVQIWVAIVDIDRLSLSLSSLSLSLPSVFPCPALLLLLSLSSKIFERGLGFLPYINSFIRSSRVLRSPLLLYTVSTLLFVGFSLF